MLVQKIPQCNITLYNSVHHYWWTFRFIIGVNYDLSLYQIYRLYKKGNPLEVLYLCILVTFLSVHHFTLAAIANFLCSRCVLTMRFSVSGDRRKLNTCMQICIL